MKFLKEQRASFFLLALSSLFILILVFLFIKTGSIPAYSISGFGWVLTGLIFAFIAYGSSAYLISRFGEKIWIDVIIGFGLAMLLLASNFILSNSVELITGIFTYDSTNALAWSAFRSRIIFLLFDILAIIFAIVGLFFRRDKKEVANKA